MKRAPLVTVYITNYNYGQYIRKAIESVLSQTIEDFELIIIDDGSLDDSKLIIEEYSSKDNISIIYQHNKGLNKTNNVALKASKGKYIMRLDADDFLEPTALEDMSNELEKDDELGLIFPNYYLVDKDGIVVSETKRHDFKKEVNILDQPAHGACTMIRVNFLKALEGYDESFTCQDGYELWVKFVGNYKVTNINKTLFSYRRHNNNLTNNEARILGTRIKIKEKYVNKENLSLPNTAGVIALRPNHPLTFEKFGDATFLDFKISQFLNAKKLDYVIVVSSDIAIEEYVKKQYSNQKVNFFIRPETLERINVSLFDTMLFLDEKEELKDVEAYMFCSIEYPLLSSEIVDDSINTLAIFNADSLVSVRPEVNKFFVHTGNGMKAILQQEKFTKLEREEIYKYSGGVILSKKSTAKENRKLIHGKVGHVVIEEKASLNAMSSFERKLCNDLLKENRGV